MDFYADCFYQSVMLASERPENGVAVKFSPLVDYKTLKKASLAQRSLLELFNDAASNDPEAKEVDLEKVGFNANVGRSSCILNKGFQDDEAEET